MRKYLLIIFIVVSPFLCHSQPLINDKEILTQIRAALDLTYEFEFDKAEKEFLKIKETYPKNPAYSLLMAINTYWRMYTNNNYKDKSGVYLFYLEKTLELTEPLLNKNPKDPEGVFYSLAAYSSLALYYSVNNDNMKAVNMARKTYEFMKIGFELKDEFTEFYFTTGLYDYYVEQFPESHPIYKPFKVFFADGNKQRGLREIEQATRNSVFSKTEAYNYLSNIYLRYEGRPDLAYPYAKAISAKFPSNFYFLMRYTETLIGTGRYDEAEKNASKLIKSGKKFFELAGNVFMGQVNEKSKHKPEHAKAFYLEAVKLAPEIENPTNDYLSFAYCGLARIADSRNEKDKARSYYHKALKIAQYEPVKREAQNYLNKNDRKQ